MLVAFAGVPFLEVTLSVIATGLHRTAHVPIRHRQPAITSNHLGIEFNQLKGADAGSLAKIEEKVEAPATT